MAERDGAEGSLAMLDAAMACFASAERTNPAYGESCEQWRAMCLGQKGNVAFAMDDLANAELWLLEATRLRPDRIHVDLGGGETVQRGLLRLGDRTMRDFARTEALFRQAAAIADPDVDLLNNAAVYARDRGVQLEESGRYSEAESMFERSYETYLRAVALDPRSVRLRNDCALVAIHHLEKEWDSSRQMLDAAIEDGERRLRESPPADARQLQDLDEAVGDCFENLALWHLKHDQDHAAAEAAARRSLEHHPRQERGGALRHLESAQRMRSASAPDSNDGRG
jgi:tetratricopeptide (TPR) repeat protein